MAALLPFGKVIEFLSELLPLSAETSVNTVRKPDHESGQAASEISGSSRQPLGQLFL
jgi:hypothetical protein